MGLFKRGDSPYFWGKFKLSWMQKPVVFSTEETDVKLAEMIFVQRRAEYQMGKVRNLPSDLKFSVQVKKFLASLSTQGICQQHIEKTTYYFTLFQEFFGDVKISSIDRNKVREAKTDLQGRGLKFSTINRHMSGLRRFFNWCIEEEADKKNPAVLVNPVKAIKFEKEDELARERFLEHPEKTLFYKTIPEYLRGMVIVAVKTGMRWGEQFDVDGLKWSQINFDNDDIYLPKTKSDRSRHIPMHSDVKAIFEKLPRHGIYVFSNEDGSPLVKNNFYHLRFLEAVEKLKLTGLTWHCLRHTFGKECAEAGTPQALIMEWMGHSSLKTSQRYMHFSNDYKKEAMRSMPSEKSYVEVTPRFSIL